MPAPNLIWGGCARKEEHVPCHAAGELGKPGFAPGSDFSGTSRESHRYPPWHPRFEKPCARASPFFSGFNSEGCGLAGLWTHSTSPLGHRGAAPAGRMRGNVLLWVVNDNYGLCEQSSSLKMMFGSLYCSMNGQALSALLLVPLHGVDTPCSFSFGFSFLIPAFPQTPLPVLLF